MNKDRKMILEEHFYRALVLLNLFNPEYHLEISSLSEFKSIISSEIEPIGEMILEEKGDKIICKGARILDSDEIPIEELIKAVYHECRHIWQIENYPDIWSWWVFGSKENYIKFIDEPICAIEYDAWKFGESYGEEMHYEILLKAIPVKILDKFKDNLDYLNSELYKASKGESKIFKFITK